MNRLPTSPGVRINAIWGLTLVLTLVSTLLASHYSSSGPLTTRTAETMAVLALAVVKVLCIIWNFMEVRHAPRWLRHCTIGWVGGLWFTIVVIYLY
jgi:heme/copper-type cytochrome/quinol oxidase subunit 4